MCTSLRSVSSSVLVAKGSCWEVLQVTPCSVYLWLESRAERINISYSMHSAIAPDRHSASEERVDSSSVLVAKVSSLPKRHLVWY